MTAQSLSHVGGPAPTVFVSHATEDKDRFVLGFAERLRANGVDAWLDKWEMCPGDRLVDKVFEGGIGNTDIFLIVLSHHSLTKPWVREELDAGLVLRIEGKCRLIPVLIDDVEVPVALKGTLWQRITDVASYDDEFATILRAIYGVTDRPPLGSPPGYTQATPLPGLTPLDALVLSIACELAITENELMVQGPRFREACRARALTVEAVLEGLFALDSLGFLKEVQFEGDDFPLFVFLSRDGLMTYLRAARPDLGDVQHDLIAHLVNDTATSFEIDDLATMTGQPTLIVDTLLEPYANRNLLTIVRLLGGRSTIHVTSPLLQREL